MDDGEPRTSRRRLLRVTGGSGVTLGLAGCLSASGDKFTRQDSRTAEGWCFDDLSESVPEAERTATSIDGHERRDAGELATKEQVAYSCGPEEGMQCGNCTFYIDDETGDAVGACTEVEGEIRSVDWCALWQKREKAAGPAGP